jgi:hypothetical protein
MLLSWRFSRRVSRQGSSPAATVGKWFPQHSPPGKRNPGFSIVIMLSCSGSSSTLGAHSPSNVNSNASPNLARLIRVARTHRCLPLLLALPLSSRSRLTPNWARLAVVNVIAVVGKGIGHTTGPRRGGAPQQRHQIRAANTSESWFEERVDDDKKGKGKVKEAEKEALPNRVKQMGIDRWGELDKKDLADYLKGQDF